MMADGLHGARSMGYIDSRAGGLPAPQDLRVLCAMSFHSIYAHGFARVAACVTTSHVADPTANAKAVIVAAKACDAQSVAVSVFPELCLSGYAIEDLVKQDPLLDAVERGLVSIV